MEALSDFDRAVAGYIAGLSPRTRPAYRYRVRDWLRWCRENRIDPGRATRTHIEVYGQCLLREGKARTTAATALSVVCGLYRRAREDGAIGHDPGEHVRRPRLAGHSEGTSLDRAQARRFLDAATRADGQTVALCLLLLLNGTRIGETLELDAGDFHDDARPWVFLHRKFDWMQRVALAPAVADALRAHLGMRSAGPVFRRAGRRMTDRDAVVVVSSVAFVAGLPGITPHSLRRTFCTLSRDAGVPDVDIQASGGWSSRRMLDYYDMGRRALASTAPEDLQRYLED